MNPKAISLILLLLLLFFFPSDSLQNGIIEDHRPYWLKIKSLFTHAQSYFFPPNIDFRGTTSNANDESGTEGGFGDKVKEAVTKSLGKGEATVEESAKSAAQKLKDTLSFHHQPQEL